MKLLFLVTVLFFLSLPFIFAESETIEVSIPQGTSVPGCEETNACYIPYKIVIDVGDKVIWTNDDSAAHTVTSGTPGEGPDGVFDSSLFMPGDTFSHKFGAAGSYNYFCMVHPWMEGVMVVSEPIPEPVPDSVPADSDGDGIPDIIDSCPTQAETFNRFQDSDGCPDTTPSATATGMLSDGTMVSIFTSIPTASEGMEISIEFEDAEHVNHDITVTQNGNTLLDDMGAHHHDGKGTHMTQDLSSSDPVDVTITFQGYGVDDPKTGPIGEEVVFSNVVPEFGTIVMMIFVVSIISIIAVTAKSRVIPRL